MRPGPRRRLFLALAAFGGLGGFPGVGAILAASSRSSPRADPGACSMGPVITWVRSESSLVAWPFGYAWLGPGPDFLATAAVPVALGWAWSRFCERRLSPNLFVYVLVQGFLGGALAIAASNLGKYLAAAWLELPGAGFYLLATPLMMFGEAFLTGGAMALIVVYRPHWCSTFDDARYLRPR